MRKYLVLFICSLLLCGFWTASWLSQSPTPPAKPGGTPEETFEKCLEAFKTQNRAAIDDLLSEEILQHYSEQQRAFYFQMIQWQYKTVIAQAQIYYLFHHETRINGKEACSLSISYPSGEGQEMIQCLLLKENGIWKICFPCDLYQSMGAQTTPAVVSK